MTIAQWVEQIQKGDTTALARAITLVESERDEDWQKAKELIGLLKPSTQETKRLGFSGPPGVGKSTLIENVGLEILKTPAKVAVLAVDPSSELTGGSILGDKTRMERLSKHDDAFVRPSPTRGHLGGVTSRLPGVILLCEAAGYDWILIESVGVGQSEVELNHLVDVFCLVSQPGAGDELQGIKRGILEYVDIILVNKADRDPQLVNTTKQQLLAALKILHGDAKDVLRASGLTGLGVPEFLEKVNESLPKKRAEKRPEFYKKWFESLVLSEFRRRLSNNPLMSQNYQRVGESVASGSLTTIEGVDQFFSGILTSPT